MFVSLHNHTWASNQRLLDSINRPEEMVARAIELGYSGIAFTDHESLSAGITILKIKDKIKETNPDFKIIFGNEIYLIDETEIKNTTRYYHFILLAKDEEGWQQLKTLSSGAWLRGYTEKGIMRVPTTYQDIERVVGSNPGHLIASTACIGGYLPQAILNNDVPKAVNFIKWMIKVFKKENICLEMQPSDSEEQIKVNKAILNIAKKNNIRFIITTDSHYLNKEDAAIHASYLNSKFSSDRETEKFYKFTYLIPTETITEIMAAGGINSTDVEEAFKNTCDVASMISDFDFRHSTIVPAPKLPEFKVSHLMKEYYEKYPMLKHYATSKYPQDQYLMYQIEQGIKEKNIVIDDLRAKRIHTELDVILFISKRLKQDVSAYLNLTASIVNLAWQVSLTGVGRGSACGFYINYLIGITQADPLKYDLPYWRFLNKERVEMPDVDEDFQPEKTADIIELLRKEYGEDNVLNCATFKTEGLKSAILSCCRGLGINNDEAAALAAIVPSHRGKLYTLEDCLNGNPEQGLEPVPYFKDKLDKYEGLFDAVKKIEGLPTNASIHASALYIFNNGYLEHNSLMRAPNKTKMTAFNMHDSDDQGALKMDVLRTDAQSKMAKCLELLLKDKLIEWQGSIRATYDKYLHPDVLDYENPKMWEEAANGRIANLFQFETQVGSVCIKKARPTNVMQLAEINSIMRLQAEGDEQPIDRYVKFSRDIKLWYKEMQEEGLDYEEMEILDTYLKKSFGVSGSQETLMLLVMDPRITGFTLGEANGFRKAIAKKIAADIQKNKQKYFENGKKLGTNPAFLNYVWKRCVEPQLGYSFSLNHTLPYSIIAVQEMNLATRWNPLYWACACLCVNSGNYAKDINTEDYVADGDENPDEDYSYEEEEQEEVEEEQIKDGETVKVKRVAPNYGKIAKAISDAQMHGINVELPDINSSEADFMPDIENNAISYGLQAINVVNPELMDAIIKHRPYTSMEDFLQKVEITTVQMIGLIKAGCFDKLTRLSRTRILLKYFQYEADKNIAPKAKMTNTQLKKAIAMGLEFPFESQLPIRIFKFRAYVAKHFKTSDGKNYIIDDPDCLSFFRQYLENKMQSSKGHFNYVTPESVWVNAFALDRVVNDETMVLLNYLKSEAGTKAFHKSEQAAFINNLLEKYGGGSVASWEMETMCFYHEKHELAGLDREKYGVVNFFEQPEIPTFKEVQKGESVIRVYDNYAIAGTVINTNNIKHIVTVLTLDGVVNVKFYDSIYVKFNQKISKIDPITGKKVVIDNSWFKRGSKILIYGYRKENMFSARAERSSGFKRTVCKINSVYENGGLDMEFVRKKD